MKREELTIFVGPITNLADARFYAAFEFDYLLFDLREKSPHKVDLSLFEEIKQWVAGVNFACISNLPNPAFSLQISEQQLAQIETIKPDKLAKFNFESTTFLINLSPFLSTPVTHYELVGNWFETSFEE